MSKMVAAHRFLLAETAMFVPSQGDLCESIQYPKAHPFIMITRAALSI